MSKGLQIVALALLALAVVPAGAAATAVCWDEDEARISAVAPDLVRVGDEFRVALEGWAEADDAYSNVVVTVGDVATPVTLTGSGSASVTVKAPESRGPFDVTVSWDQIENADGYGRAACSNRTVLESLAASWSGRAGNVKQARVDGRWSGSWTLPDGRRRSFRFHARPTCGIGACDWRFAGSRGLLRLEFGAYRYTLRERDRVSCDLGPGGVVQSPVTFVSRLWIRPARSTWIGDELSATRLTGHLVQSVTGVRGPATRCRYPSQRATFAASRL